MPDDDLNKGIYIGSSYHLQGETSPTMALMHYFLLGELFYDLGVAATRS
jgi:hypothetical protein